MAGPCMRCQETAEKVSSGSTKGFDIMLECLPHVVDGPVLGMFGRAWGMPLDETQTMSHGGHLKRKRVEDSMSVDAATEVQGLALPTGASLDDIEYAKRFALAKFAEDFFNGRSGSGSTFKTSRWMKLSKAVETRGDVKQTDITNEETPLGIASCSPVVPSKSSTTWLSSLSSALQSTDAPYCLSSDDEAKLSKLTHEVARIDLRNISCNFCGYKLLTAVIQMARIWQTNEIGEDVGFERLRRLANELSLFGLKEVMMSSIPDPLFSWNADFAHKFRVVLVRTMAHCEQLCKKYGSNAFPRDSNEEGAESNLKVKDKVRDLIIDVSGCNMRGLAGRIDMSGIPLSVFVALCRTWRAVTNAPLLRSARGRSANVRYAKRVIHSVKPWKNPCMKGIGINWDEQTWMNLGTRCQEDEQFMDELDRTVRRLAVSARETLRGLSQSLRHISLW